MKNKFSLKWILDEYALLFNMIKISENLIREKFIEFFEKQPDSNGKDFLWSFFHFLIIETSKNSKDEYDMHHKHSHIYFYMARFRRKYENSKANNIFQLKLNSELRSFERITGYRMVAEIISNQCCDYCESMNGKTFDIDYAIETKPYDAEKCTWEYGCRSCYCVVAERDENGNLIHVEEN